MNATLEKEKVPLAKPAAQALKRERASAAGQDFLASKTAGLERLLVPIDFSETSIRALPVASELAGKFGATLRLLHVVEPVVLNGLINIALAVSQEEIECEAKAQLINLARKQSPGEIAVSPEVRVGKPFREIVEAARRMKASLIVMATHGFTGMQRVLMGSTTERVIRHAPCPVLVVPKPETTSSEDRAVRPRLSEQETPNIDKPYES